MNQSLHGQEQNHNEPLAIRAPRDERLGARLHELLVKAPRELEVGQRPLREIPLVVRYPLHAELLQIRFRVHTGWNRGRISHRDSPNRGIRQVPRR